MKFSLSQIMIRPDTEIRKAIEVIDKAAIQVAFVTDNSGVLIATVTDGDVRRGLLRGVSLEMPVSSVMNSNPLKSLQSASEKTHRTMLLRSEYNQLPIVNSKGQLVDVILRHSTPEIVSRSTPVVLMAGGLGTRLRPLTDKTPKPMLSVAGKPLLERIIQRFKAEGFRHIVLSLNYLGHIIREHFEDGKDFGITVDYIEEVARMGTCGALSLIQDRPKEPFIVMNGDILTTAPFGAIVDFHLDSGSCITVCARRFEMQVPYGVLNTHGDELVSMVEKPINKHLVNAGMYVLSPQIFEHLNEGEYLDMPELINRVQNAGSKVGVFTINEYWVDIGQIHDLDRAREEYHAVFGE